MKDYRLRCRFFYRWSPSEHQLGRYKPTCGIRKIHLPCSKCRDCKYGVDTFDIEETHDNGIDEEENEIDMIVNLNDRS